MRQTSLPIVAAAALLVGCAAPASSPAGTASTSPSATAAPSDASQATGLGVAGRDAVVVAGRTGAMDLQAIVASSGEVIYSLPGGIPTSAD